MSRAQKEYIVTLKDYNLLEGFYNDMESEYSMSTFLPNRSVECVSKRPKSRNTHYLLTDDEARDLANDPRVEAVTVKIKNLSTNTKLHSSQTGIWSRGPDVAVGQKNWGLYRCQLDENIPQWGSESGEGDDITSTIKINATGKNVDIVVIDETTFVDHPEFSGRVVEYDWFGQHDGDVKGTGINITFVNRAANVATITTQSAHGLTTGNFVNVTCSNTSFSTNGAVEVIDVPTPTTFQYSNSGGTVPSTAATGTWIGEYQYTQFDNYNNHATHMTAVISGETQGWARDANLYNLRNEASTIDGARDSYPMSDFLIDYVREFHATKSVNPTTGRKNPTLVNNSWGFGTDVSALTNFYTGNTRFSKLSYRGSLAVPAGSAVDTGISGIFTASAKVADMNSVAPGAGNRIVTTDGTTGTVSSVSYSANGRTGLSDVGSPTSTSLDGIDSNDDAYWGISLPFTIRYLGQNYTDLFVGSNSYITFAAGKTDYYIDETLPVRKIYVSAGDRNCDSVWTGTFGSAPNRTFIIRWEGYDGAYGGAYEVSPNIIWEMKFYEATPTQIDLKIVSNANYRAEFTQQELTDYGLNLQGPAAPYRNAAMDADIADAISEGIIFVGSAGNSSTKIDVEGGLDYNNYFVDNGLPIYYHRGSSPGATAGVICVGESSGTSAESKSQSSNTGPRVDLYAPGTNVISAVYSFLASGSDIVNDGSTTASLSSASSSSGVVTVVTTSNHNFSNGTIVTIQNCSNANYNVSRAAISVINSTSFSYTIPFAITGGSESVTGTVWSGYMYQKTSGTSVSAAQVTGLLALALEQYPWMTQEDARNYILSYAKNGVIIDTEGDYTDVTSLQGGNNKFAYYYKERPDDGILVPKSKQWLRPNTGLLFPRPPIRKK